MQPALSFPEPTCLLVSTKTRSSGIINKLIPRALVSFAFKILLMLFFQSQISTFLVYPVCIECLCGTHPHRLHLWTPNKPTQVCTVKPEVLKSWSLEIDYSRAPCLGADQKARGLWERDCETCWSYWSGDWKLSGSGNDIEHCCKGTFADRRRDIPVVIYDKQIRRCYNLKKVRTNQL